MSEKTAIGYARELVASETRAHWLQGCARHALVKLSDAAQPEFSLIRNDLAQRILAALEGRSMPGGFRDELMSTLAAELRAAVERKT